MVAPHAGLKNFSGTLGQRTGAAFGNGIYLSDSLQLAQNFAPVQSTAGRMWGGASYGGEISCVAVCEVLLHPDVRRPGVESRRTDMLGGKVRKRLSLRTFILKIIILPRQARDKNKHRKS